MAAIRPAVCFGDGGLFGAASEAGRLPGVGSVASPGEAGGQCRLTAYAIVPS